MGGSKFAPEGLEGCVLARLSPAVPLSRIVQPRAALSVGGGGYIYISLSLNVLKTISNDIARAIQVCCCSQRPASTQQRLCGMRPYKPLAPRAWPSPPPPPSSPPGAPGSGSRGGVLGAASAHWFNSSAQTCCGQPVRPLILFSPGPRAGGKPSCCCCQRTHTRKEARDRFKFFCSYRPGIESGW